MMAEEFTEVIKTESFIRYTTDQDILDVLEILDVLTEALIWTNPGIGGKPRTMIKTMREAVENRKVLVND